MDRYTNPNLYVHTSPSPLSPCASSHLCLFIVLRELCVCVCCSVCREGAAGASAVVSSDSSTAYGMALWRMGAVTRQSAYPPTGEASHTNTMRKRRKQLNISTPLIYFPTATSLQEGRSGGALMKRTPTGSQWPRRQSKCISVNRIEDRQRAQDKPLEIYQFTQEGTHPHICTHQPLCVTQRCISLHDWLLVIIIQHAKALIPTL